MAKVSLPLLEVSRLLDLVPYLSSHSHISLKELAAEFGVSEKEIVRELTALSMCGLPGYTPYELIEVYFDSGFVTINNHEPLNMPRALTMEEVAALYIGLELIREPYVGTGSSSEGAINELLVELGALTNQSLEIESSPLTPTVDFISSAIASQRNIRITYLSAATDVKSEREIKPLSLYSDAGHLYLNSYCLRAKGYRNFRVDRIEIIETVENSDIPEEHLASDSHSKVAEFEVLKNARAHAEMWGIDLVGSRAVISYFDSTWLLRTAISASGEVRAVAPEALIEEIRLTSERILDLYR